MDEPVSGLTYAETARVLQIIAPVMPDLVLVGGQAVNFWAEQYRPVAPDELRAGPYTSKDIDFQGSRKAASECAIQLGGQVRFPASTDHAPIQTGKVVFQLGGVERVIDFLGSVCGLTNKEIADGALPIKVLDETGAETGAAFRVMHPVDCVISRASNVAILEYYRTPHGLQQLRAAIVCGREFIREAAENERVRAALNMSERLWRFARHAASAAYVYRHYQIEVFDAVKPHDALPARFRSERYPQMHTQIEARRLKQQER